MTPLSLLKIVPPKKIQLKSTVKASEIAHHKPQHSTVNIGRIRSNQVTNQSTISHWVRWLMHFIWYTAMQETLQQSAPHHGKS
jgi:hypothetical protein